MDPAAPEAPAPETASDVRPSLGADSEPEVEPVLLFAREESRLYRISDNKTVEKVVIHGDDSDRYLSTSEGGVAHVLDLHLSSVDSWFKDSPYTWGAPQGTSSTMVLIRGRWKRYSVRTRTCTPPMVCSLMPADVANMPHTEVNFDDPTWLSAMAMCEDDDDPASRVHKTSMAYFRTLQNMEGGCSFADKDEIPCGGHPVFFPRKAGRGAFIGCSNWQPGDPLTSKGGHMFRCIRPGVDPDLIKTWMENGIEDVASSDSCSYISGKRFKELTCNRHGGENPRLKRSGGGECPVRVEFLSPVGSTGDTVRVFVIWRGTHSHVFPVCKPSSRLVQDVVQENPSASIRALQATISDASGGGQASTSFVRKLRHSARSTTHPFGQDLLGVMDLYRRSGYRHDYVKAIIQRPAYTAVVLQPEKQADMAGQMRFIEADSAFGVVTRGTAKDGVQAEAISEAGKQAFDWHQFSIISLVPWLNRAVTLLRAMVIGKTASMYEDLFEYYFSTAAEHGLAGPGGRVAVRAGGGTSSRRTPFVAATMEFETAQHTGYARGLCHVFGGEAADYTGRVIGCAVHFKRFLLGPSGNSLDDPFFVSMMRLRDADSVGGEGDVRERLTSMAAEYRKSSQPKKVNVIQWLLKNPAAFSAAFPKSSGRLNKFELLARPDNTNACESLNRQKKQVVSDARATTLLEVIAALSDFDGRTMAAITSNGRGTPSGVSQVARMNRAAKRKRKSNVVPSSGQPPKAAMRRGTGTNPPQGATAADPHSVAVRDAARGAGAAAGVAPTVRGKTPSATTGEGVARAPPLWQSSPELMAEFELFLAARQQKRTAGADGGASK